MKMLFLLKIYQLFHSCKDNPEIVMIVLIKAETELGGEGKFFPLKVFFSSERPPAIVGGRFPLQKSTIPWKDRTKYPNILMLLFSSPFLNGLP